MLLESSGEPQASLYDVKLVGVSKTFGVTWAVRDLTLQVERGIFYSLLGPSGCGKTTTLRLIAGFEQPTAGQVLIRGVDVTASLRISLAAALLNAALAVMLGTLAALGMRSAPRWLRIGFEGLVYMTIITPEIVVAIASLLYFVSLNVNLGLQTIVVTHAVYNTSIVTLVIATRLAGMDRTLEEASADLGATPFGTFWRVTLPQLYPAILASALLAFTFSFDDFILSFFVSGVGSTTLPLNLFSRLRFGVSPIINAVAATMLTLTLTAIVVAQLVLRGGVRRTRSVAQ